MADAIDVIEMFKQAAFEVDNRRLPELKADTVIATLGMDSVAVMELVSYFEEKLRVRIPDGARPARHHRAAGPGQAVRGLNATTSLRRGTTSPLPARPAATARAAPR